MILSNNLLLARLKNYLKQFTSLLILFPTAVSAGAWVNKPGEITLIHNFYANQYSRYVNESGDYQSNGDFAKFEYKPYFEYGLTDNFSAGLSPSFQDVAGEYTTAFETGVDGNSGFVYSDVFVKRKLYEGAQSGTVVSISPSVEIPGVYKEETTPFFGKQESFWGLTLAAGTNIYNIENNYGYVNVEAGVRSRFTDAFTDESGSSFKTDILASFPITEKSSGNFGITYTKTLAGYTGGAYSFLDRYGYDAASFKATNVYTFGDYGIEYGAVAQFYARNAGVGEALVFSVWKKF